jgi:PAS domain S-box-containing protein
MESRSGFYHSHWLPRFAQLAADFVARCKYESELSESAQRYRQLVHGLSDTIVWEGNPEGFRLTFVSPAAEALLGYPVEQWLIEPDFWINRIHPDDRERAVAYCSQETSAGRNHEFEYRMLAADGRVVWLRDRVYVAQVENGERRLCGVMLDVTQEKEAEQRLSESEERFQLMSEAAPAMIWVSDQQGRCLHVNRMLREFWNIDEEKLAEFDWTSMLHPEDVDEIRRKVQIAREMESPLTIQARFRNACGEYRIIKTQAQPRFSSRGEFFGFVGINIDLTNEIQAFEALRESEERFARFMRQLPGLAWIKDSAGRYVFANDAAAKLYGSSPRKLRELTDHELFPADLAAQFRRNDLLALKQGAGMQFVETLDHEDGTSHHFIVSKFPIPGPAGRPALIGGVAFDITDRKTAEDRIAELNDDLRHRLEELEALLHALPVGVFIAQDAQCSNIQMNPAGAAMLQLPLMANASKSGADADRLPFRTFKNGVEIAPENLPMQRAARTGEPVTGEEVELVFSDGTSRVLYEHASPLFDASGAVRGCVGVFDDVTERKRADRHQKLLIGELNHRVKNTLAIAQSIASLTLRESPDPAVFKEAFSARLAALAHTHSLLTATSWKGVSLRELTLTALKPFESRGKAIRIDGPPIMIKPDTAVTLSLVLHELATNAAKHGALSSPDGRLSISWNKTNSHPVGLELRWREEDGPAVIAPRRTGFGSRLIGASASQLGGTVDLNYRPEGVEAHFFFALE